MRTHIKTKVPALPPEYPSWEKLFATRRKVQVLFFITYVIFVSLGLIYHWPALSILGMLYQFFLAYILCKNPTDKIYIYIWNKKYRKAHEYWKNINEKKD